MYVRVFAFDLMNFENDFFCICVFPMGAHFSSLFV